MLKIQQNILTNLIPSYDFHTYYAPVDLRLYIIALEGKFNVTISQNMQTVNSKRSGKILCWNTRLL
jgi:hypothetical protein